MNEPIKNESEDPKKSRAKKIPPEASGELAAATPVPGATFLNGPLPTVPVTLRRAEVEPTPDQVFWAAIRNRTKAIRFDAFNAFIEKAICRPVEDSSQRKLNYPNAVRLDRQSDELYAPLHGVGAYELLKTATQVFLLLEAGLCPDGSEGSNNPDSPHHYNLHPKDISDRDLFNEDDESTRFGRPISFDQLPGLLKDYLGDNRLPYIQTVISNAFRGITEDDTVFCSGFLTSRADCPPLLELIWSYWHEEAMLVQSMNAISLRFQNRRRAAAHDPLAHLEIAPLFPVNNLLWGYIQDEHQRLSVPRRAYEYNHHYGLTLAGKAIPDFHPAETRSKFLEAFHHLLNQAGIFFKQDDDVTFNADGFPVLNALKEVHLLLSEGQQKQIQFL